MAASSASASSSAAPAGAAAAPASTEPRCVQEGDWVLLTALAGFSLFSRVSRGSKVRLGKQVMESSHLIGLPYGTVFEVDKKPARLRVIADRAAFEMIDEAASFADSADLEASKLCDNALVVDETSSQKLSAAQITAMKETMATDDLVKALEANNSSIATRTAMTKAKYRAKKKKKHSTMFRICIPSAYEYTERYYAKRDSDMLFLRPHMIAHMLHFANVRAGGASLVIDGVRGFLTAAVARRHAGHGVVLSGYEPPSQSEIGLEMLNLRSNELEAVVPFRLDWVRPLMALADGDPIPLGLLPQVRSKFRVASKPRRGATDAKSQPQQQQQKKNASAAPLAEAAAAAASSAAAASTASAAAAPAVAAAKDKKNRYPGRPGVEVAQLLAAGADSLLVASPHDPCQLVPALLQLLKPSSPFAVYSAFQEPLVELLDLLREMKTVVGARVETVFYREMQVLPMRTHPTMSTDARTGYVLHGTYIVVPPAPTSAGAAASASSAGVAVASMSPPASLESEETPGAADASAHSAATAAVSGRARPRSQAAGGEPAASPAEEPPATKRRRVEK